ncbi:MAG: hypothetical protein IPH15_03910 [Comamonadaceae bacterium]|nr:hypothetical protein [Comamonadaceae bacterium]
MATGTDVDIGLRSFNAATSGIEVIDASGATGTVRLVGDWSADTIDLRGVTVLGNVVVDGYHGNDALFGNDADNTLRGGGGDDTLNGGNGSDTYLVSGNQAGGWSSFVGFDTYADTGALGTDRIVATGADVDIGLRNFSAASSGIEEIDASGATGTVRLVGDWSADTIDLRGVTVWQRGRRWLPRQRCAVRQRCGQHAARGGGDDTLDGGNGGDTYLVSGNQAGGWSSFVGFDTYADTGALGTDRIVATGADVDIGLRNFSAANGIEEIDASGATGTVRLVGDWSADTIDLRGVTVLGNVVVDGYHGNDALFGNDADNTLRGGGGDDSLNGGNGSDTYLVSGNQAGGWSSFVGFDTYADTGALGTDRIVATGADVDIGLRNFSAASSGIEEIDASGATGTVRLVGDWSADTIDLRGVTVLGNVVVDGYHGNDALFGNDADNTLRGGGGDDTLDGGNGGDTYLVSGNQAGGWSSFVGFDTYADTGALGTDRIVATGADVDIGLRSFSAATQASKRLMHPARPAPCAWSATGAPTPSICAASPCSAMWWWMAHPGTIASSEALPTMCSAAGTVTTCCSAARDRTPWMAERATTCCSAARGSKRPRVVHGRRRQRPDRAGLQRPQRGGHSRRIAERQGRVGRPDHPGWHPRRPRLLGHGAGF